MFLYSPFDYFSKIAVSFYKEHYFFWSVLVRASLSYTMYYIPLSPRGSRYLSTQDSGPKSHEIYVYIGICIYMRSLSPHSLIARYLDTSKYHIRLHTPVVPRLASRTAEQERGGSTRDCCARSSSHTRASSVDKIYACLTNYLYITLHIYIERERELYRCIDIHRPKKSPASF